MNWNPNSRTVARLCVIAMTAAMKNVLSPISEAKIIDAERTKPSSKSALLVLLDENIFDVVGVVVSLFGRCFLSARVCVCGEKADASFVCGFSV